MALYQVSSYFHSNLHSKPQDDWEEPQNPEVLRCSEQQRVLDNAVVLWQRFVEENRRDVVCLTVNLSTERQTAALHLFNSVAARLPTFSWVNFLRAGRACRAAASNSLPGSTRGRL